MNLDLAIAFAVVILGTAAFHRFVTEKPLRRKILKWVIYLGLAALLSTTLGRPWSLLWILGLPLVGGVVHTIWTRKHGITLITAEPREKFYGLMGWEWPGKVDQPASRDARQ